MASSILKKSTRLAGLKVSKHPEYEFRVVLGKILRVCQRMPPQSSYRKYTEELVKSRLQVVVDSKSAEEIESKINCGQIEELIEQGENELLLARRMLIFKPHEPLVEAPLPEQWEWPPK